MILNGNTNASNDSLFLALLGVSPNHQMILGPNIKIRVNTSGAGGSG